ncbi:Rv2578c family radical SAM protein [uncultured Pseudokineococcus sp.]|uniref:Rv2578c family radical SAM protein n=1 Tax=uncultured Pseudokineococcus sp. TaxID=1642928 RepID=UPI002607869F|nr:Rv2578c family radical SAM protein [uncultured Pseudokineococcus sp.]
MRWQAQTLGAVDDGALPGLPAASIPGLQRTVRTPEFADVTFHEVRARSVLNAVPAGSSMPFRWTVNPYRGCSHACVYCFARGTHAYLDLDTGEGFDREVVVKTNVADVLRRELGRASWEREHVALGTNTDPYQRAEGRYRLMPGVVEALASSGTPFSVLTKGTLLARDLPQLSRAAGQVPVGVGVSLAIWDDALHAALEPGTPSPAARLELVRRVRDAGLPCGVFVAPVLPWLTDTVEHLDEALGRVAAAGATGVTVLPLHLRPGAREWFWAWLERTHPRLVPRYARLYGRGAYVPAHYRTWLTERLAPLLERHGLDRQRGGAARGVPGDDEGSFPAGSLPDVERGTSPARPAAPAEVEQLPLAL